MWGGGFPGRRGPAPPPASASESQVRTPTPLALAAAPRAARAALPACFSASHACAAGLVTQGEGAMVHKITHIVLSKFLFKLGCSRKSSHRSCHPATLLPQPLCVCMSVHARACHQLTPCRWIRMPEEVSFEAPLAVRVQLALSRGCAVARSVVALPRVCGCGLETSSLVKCQVQGLAIPQVHQGDALVSARPFQVGLASHPAPGGRESRRPPRSICCNCSFQTLDYRGRFRF